MGRSGRSGRRLLAWIQLLAVTAAACGGGGAVEFETRAVAPARAEAGPEPGGPTRAGGLLPVAGAGPAGAEAPAGGVAAGGGLPAARAETGDGSRAGPRPTIRLGTVLPLQGGQRDFGEPVLRVTQAFVDEVNDRGGVNGARLELVAYNACLTCQDEALQAVRRLVEEDKVFALVNTYVMVVAFIPVIEYLDEKGVPLIQGGAEDMTSDALSPVTFATAPPGAFYGKFIPQVVKRYMQVSKIGLVYLDVPSEANGIPTLKEEFAREGIEVVHEEKIEAAEEAVTNMDAAVTRMRLAGAQGVVATNPVLLAFGRLAADRQGWPVPWYGPAAWSRLLEEGCGTVCDEVVFTDTAGLSYTDRATPQMRQFLTTLARRYPEGATTGHELAAWVGMQLLTETLARTGPDRRAFITALERTTNLDLGTTSPLSFNPDRHLGGTSTVLLKLKDGRYVRASEPLNFGELKG